LLCRINFPFLTAQHARILLRSLSEKYRSAIGMANPLNKLDTLLSQTATMRDERRKVPRYSLSMDTEVEECRSQTIINGRMTDLGMGGCYIDTLSVFPVGTDVVVRILRDDVNFEAHGNVIYGKQGMGMGLGFKELTRAQQQQLYHWVEELSGKSAAPKPAKPALPETVDSGNGTVLGQLITLLMRKGVVSQSEYEQLLREIERRSRFI
jgi:hypothetical protein